MIAGQLSGPLVRRYALAGNARFTLSSEKTGQRFTYRIRAKDDGAVFFVSLLAGPDNTSDYRYLGFIREGTYVHGRAKAKISPDAPSARAFAWFWSHVDALPPSCSVFHEGRCGRCNRVLTVPESVSTGLGPECAGRAS